MRNQFAIISIYSKVVFDMVKANSLQLAILQSISQCAYMF